MYRLLFFEICIDFQRFSLASWSHACPLRIYDILYCTKRYHAFPFLWISSPQLGSDTQLHFISTRISSSLFLFCSKRCECQHFLYYSARSYSDTYLFKENLYFSIPLPSIDELGHSVSSHLKAIPIHFISSHYYTILSLPFHLLSS